MGNLPGLPTELLLLIIDHLHDDWQALRACALVSRAFVARSQEHLFERIRLGDWQDAMMYADEAGEVSVRGDIKDMERYISPDPDGVLSYTRSLSIYTRELTEPSDLDEIYDHWAAFKNIRELQAHFFATHFLQGAPPKVSHYFSHFQPTLRCLNLGTILKNPGDLITFIAFFPLLEEVSIERIIVSISLNSLPDKDSKEFNPDILPPFKGSLRLHDFRGEGDFLTELAKVRLQYHTLSISDATVWTGFQEVITVCAPTLRVLNMTRHTRTVHDTYWDGSPSFDGCTQLTEINLPFPLFKFFLNIDRYSTLLSSISSIHFQKITLTLDKAVSLFNSGVIHRALLHKEWQPFEDALLGVSSRSQNTLELVVVFPRFDRLREACANITFLPRFKEVGSVRFVFP